MPTAAEIKAVAYILEQDHPDKSCNDVAALCIKALDTLRKTAQRSFQGPPKVGDQYKVYGSTKAHHVLWIGDTGNGHDVAWCVSEDSHYGSLVFMTSSFWTRVIRVEPSKGVTRQGVFYPPLSERIKINDLGIKVGDILFFNAQACEVLAVHVKGALLRAPEGYCTPESNEDIEKFYKRVKM